MTSPPSLELPRWLRLLQLAWLFAISVLLVWHLSLMSVDNAEVIRPVLLAYIVVCLPIGVGVMLVLALIGWLSGGYRYDDLVAAGVFAAAGWLQWFRVAPWLHSAWKRFPTRQHRH